MNGNGDQPGERSNLIDIGYNKEGMVILIMNGEVEGKPFQAISKLAIPQALKLADDLKMTVITMTGEKEKV